MKLIISAQLVLLMGTVSQAFAGGSFGISGKNGEDGDPGRTGRPGRHQVIHSTGFPMEVYAEGKSGGDGYSGTDGTDAIQCIQPAKEQGSVYAAVGGYGGTGGQGGTGGDAGDLTFVYEKLEDLKLIRIHAVPGDGGRGGRGGYHGRSCECNPKQWELNGVRQYCYHSTPAPKGLPKDGYDGKKGSWGTLKIIPISANLSPSDVTSVSIKMNEMENQTYDLFKHNWELQNGSSKIFASGSTMRSSYTIYQGSIKKSVKFVWAASRPITDFTDWVFNVQLTTSGLTYAFPNELWYEIDDVVDEDGVEIVTIKKAMKYSEVYDLEIDSVSGIGTELTAFINDKQNISDVINTTKVYVWYYYLFNNQWYQVHASWIDAKHIIAKDEGITINLGALGIDDRYTKKDSEISLTFQVYRNLKNRTIYTNISSRFKL